MAGGLKVNRQERNGAKNNPDSKSGKTEQRYG